MFTHKSNAWRSRRGEEIEGKKLWNYSLKKSKLLTVLKLLSSYCIIESRLPHLKG